MPPINRPPFGLGGRGWGRLAWLLTVHVFDLRIKIYDLRKIKFLNHDS
jgi:hypothetical protein